MERVVLRVVRYRCKVCRFLHRTPKQAEQCEKRKEEPTGFGVGDRVLVEAYCECQTLSFLFSAPSWVKGKVIKKIGPLPPHVSYEREVIKIPARLKMHVFQYDVKRICYLCKRNVVMRLYAPEIQLRQI